MFDAFLLEPADVRMLDARDAYLAADVMRFGAANQAVLWDAFARRGFGEFASSGSPDDQDPVPNFESAVASNEATVPSTWWRRTHRGRPRSSPRSTSDGTRRGSPPRPTPTRRLRSRTRRPSCRGPTTSSSGRPVRRVPVHQDVRGGGRHDAHRALASNWASQSQRSQIAGGDGSNRGNLTDDTEATAWRATSLLPGVNGLQVTAKLGGGSHVLRHLTVSAYVQLGDPRFIALRSFEIWTCQASLIDPNCALPASFQRIYTSPNDAFPSVRPRPLAPDLLMRPFDLPGTTATHLRLVVRNSQCTGGPDYAGEQDNDPLNITDCVLGAVTDVSRRVGAAELEVFTSESSVS
jgi:extracellular elastinolytic metalloproteinase